MSAADLPVVIRRLKAKRQMTADREHGYDHLVWLSDVESELEAFAAAVAAHVREQDAQIATALREILDDAVGSPDDPLWIVRRELIEQGLDALRAAALAPSPEKS